jgi:acyl-CoA thioester hydrolase
LQRVPASRMSASAPRLVYQGSVNAWECDDGGHLNVRFHFERAMTGLAHLSAALAMPRAFALGAGATLLPMEAHVRFLKEARAGAPLVMHGGVAQIGESDARLLLDMRHGDGAPAAAFTISARHADPRALRAFAWSSRTRVAAKALAVKPPDHAKPRSIDLARTPGEASLARAVKLGARRIGAHLVRPEQCDAFGRLSAEFVFGFVSDSVPNLLADWRAALASDGAVTPAGAVLEARIVFRRWPQAGDLIEVHSAFAAIDEKTQRLVHWLIDPDSGAAWASVEAVSLTFDVATRKTIIASPAVRAAFAPQVVAEMSV